MRITDNELNISPIIDNVIQMQANKNNQKINLFVKDIVIKQGRVSFQDKTAGVLMGISLSHFYVHTNPLSLRTTLSALANIVSGRDDYLGKVSLRGWLNFPKKDMDARFSVEDLDAAYLYPYFSKFLSKIESGKFLFSVDAVSKDNDLTLNCHLEAQNLKFASEALAIDINNKKITLGNNLSSLVLDSVMGPGGGGIFDFSIHTKFDNPKLEGLQFKGNIFKQSIENIIKAPPQETIDTIKSIGKDFESIGKEFKQQFKDVESIFKGFKKQVTQQDNTENVEQNNSQ
jgi:hypothetical protein